MQQAPFRAVHALFAIAVVLAIVAIYIIGNASHNLLSSIPLNSRSQLAQVADTTSGLVAHFTFDEGTGSMAADSSGNGNALTLMNAPTWVNGRLGKAVSLDGQTQYVKGPAGIIPANGAMSICAWINPTSVSGTQSIVSNAALQLGLFNSGGTNFISLAGPAGTLNGAGISLNAWQFVCSTIDASGLGTIYLNGSQVGSTLTVGVSPVSNWNTGIGVRGTLQSYFFNGVIDDIRIYSRALSGNDIGQLFTNDSGQAPAGGTSGTATTTTTGNTGTASSTGTVQNNSNNYTSCGPDCYRANNVTVADVSAAIDASQAGNGGTVMIPAWTGTFGDPIKRTITKSLVITGAGRDQTIINDAINSETPIFEFKTDGNVIFHMQSMRFQKVNTGQRSKAFIYMSGTSRKQMVSDIYFDLSDAAGDSERGLYMSNTNDPAAGSGVVFNNYFRKRGSLAIGVSIDGSLYDRRWSFDAPLWGSPDKWYIEDNTFDFSGGSGGESFDAYQNANFVIRYNTIIGTDIGWHGYDSAVVSPETQEIYKNNFINDPLYTDTAFIFDRGGTGVFWGNRASNGYYTGSGSVAPIINLSYYRSTNNWNGYTVRGQCNGTAGIQGDPTTEIYNYNGVDGLADPSGWPCYEQPGMTGKNGITPWPVIEWDNQLSNGKPITFALNGNFIPPRYPYSPNEYDHVKEGRDFLNETTCAKNSAGALPYSTTGIADKATVDRVCGAFWDSTTGKAKGYVPFVYPHPMRADPNYNPVYVPSTIVPPTIPVNTVTSGGNQPQNNQPGVNSGGGVNNNQPGPTVPGPTVPGQTVPGPAKVNTPKLKLSFNRTLRLGSTGADVKALQQFLNTHGFTVKISGPGSRGNETSYFGPATRLAVIHFQEAYAIDILVPNNLKKGTGIFGPSTRKKISSFDATI